MTILTDIKKLVGLDKDYDPFDLDILIHINTAFMQLEQIGVNDKKNFDVDSSTTWEDFLGDDDTNLKAIKTLVGLQVRLLFDPPSSSFVQDSIQKQIAELTWRLNVQGDVSEDIKKELDDE